MPLSAFAYLIGYHCISLSLLIHSIRQSKYMGIELHPDDEILEFNGRTQIFNKAAKIGCNGYVSCILAYDCNYV
ncbi:unnamed protein product [Urochloa humidicola]